MKRLAIALACGACWAGCSSTPTVIPTKNMDRPTDMTFACLGMAPDGSGELSGLPMSACHARNVLDPPLTSNGQRVLGTFAFIPNATRGELAVADMDSGRLLDLTPAAPGYGLLPIGGDPEVVASTQDGCWVVTGNRSTCDFSMIDPAHLLARSFSKAGVTPPTASQQADNFHHITVETGSGRKLSTTIGQIAFLPSAASNKCSAPAVDPGLVDATAVATFPSCDMVALLGFRFADGAATVKSAYYVRPDLPGGFQAAGAEPVCPTDCATSAVDAGADTDGGGTYDGGGSSLDGAGESNSGWRLLPLALEPDGNRVYVGSLRDSAVTSLQVSLVALSAPTRFSLADSPPGVSRIRLGIDPYLPGTDVGDGRLTQGQFLDNHGKFLYVFAGDDSVRVVDITDPTPVECDVNVILDAQTVGQSCIPIGSGRRRALAQGPGLRVPVLANPDSPPPLPRDIAFADLEPTPNDTNYHSLSGQFGFLLASNGQVYVVNLAPDGEPQTATHSFREARDVGKAVRTQLVLSIAPQRLALVPDQAFATTATLAASKEPDIKSFYDGVAIDNGNNGKVTTRWFGFPEGYPNPIDPSGIVSRIWNVVWEGVLPQSARQSGLVESAGSQGSSAGVLNDSGADFCNSGVQPGDVLLFAGCAQDSDCQPDDKFSCRVTVSGGRGICLPRDNAASAALTGDPDCARFMGSRMRYEVTRATPTSLVLGLKLDEVPKTTLNPCATDADCRPDVDHGLALGGADGGVTASHAFQCLEVRPQERRCVQDCENDSDCRAGNVCETVSELIQPPKKRYCVEAPPLKQGCFPQPMTSYSVRAGNSYLVFGSSLPNLNASTASSASGSCEVKPSNGDLVARIPLSAPRCPDSLLAGASAPAKDQNGTVTAGLSVQDLSAQSGSNPCLYTGPRCDGDPNGDADCADPNSTSIRAFFENPQIRFVLTNLDQYVGDLLSIHFEFQYGYVPITVSIPSYEVQLTMPARIITGPTMTPESPVRSNSAQITYPYIYVVDQGRTALTPGSRGQVVRINPRAGSNEIVTFDTALSGSTPFQLQ